MLGLTGSPEQKLASRRAFETLHMHHRSLREEYAYLLSIRANPEEMLRWTAKFQNHLSETLRTKRAKSDAKTAELRGRRTSISSLAVSFCEFEGLELSAALDSIQSDAVQPLPGDGHPWLATGSASHIEASAEPTVRNVMRRDAAIIRGRGDLRGSATLHQPQHTVELTAHLGRACVWTKMGMANLLLPDVIPETLATALIGRRVSEFVDHPVLLGESLIIIEVKTIRSAAHRTSVRFRCPDLPVPVPLSATGGRRLSLHVDPVLDGAAATGDIVDRMALATMLKLGKISANVLLLEASDRIQRINFSRPGHNPLPDPTVSQARNAVSWSLKTRLALAMTR